jgi:hypothetical protein
VDYQISSVIDCGSALDVKVGTMERYISVDPKSLDGNESRIFYTKYYPEREQFEYKKKMFKNLPKYIDNIYSETLQSMKHNLPLMCQESDGQI